jgi:hypothetical protein
MLDEFESDQKGYGLRQVLRLARSASSADTQVLKGTPEGKAMTFSLRTTFFFAAINPRGMSREGEMDLEIKLTKRIRRRSGVTAASSCMSATF